MSLHNTLKLTTCRRHRSSHGTHLIAQEVLGGELSVVRDDRSVVGFVPSDFLLQLIDELLERPEFEFLGVATAGRILASGSVALFQHS